MTYPSPSVVEAIADGFAPFKVNMLERHPDFREACAGQRVMWGPTFVVADAKGREVRRWVGWLPPDGFVAELEFCRALAAFNGGGFAEAKTGFDALVDDAAGTAIHPEAIYWQGIAGFMAGGKDWAPLRSAWERLAREYPQHRFGTHASVIADAPAG